MQQSTIVFSAILAVVVISTMIILQSASSHLSFPDKQSGKVIPLSPFDYEQDPFKSPPKIPQYTIQDFLKRGYKLRKEGKYRKAEDILKTGLLFDPENFETIKNIGELVFLDGRYTEATNYFMQYLALRPEDVQSYTNLAMSLYCGKNFDSAEAIALKGTTMPDAKTSGPLNFILACIKANKNEISEGDDYFVLAEQLLGQELKHLLNTPWASPLKKLPSYSQIKESLDINTGPSAQIAPSKNQISPSSDE